MTLIQMKYFQSVCRAGSFTRASKLLCVSQPAVSIAVRELEEELGLQLLFRDGRNIRTTEAGSIFLAQCESLLQHATNVQELMQDLALQQQQLRLGITPTLAMAVLPGLYRHFTRRYPQIRLRITEGPRENLRTLLDRKQLDVILVNRSAALEEHYQKAHVADLPFSVCVAADHPLAGKKKLTIPELAPYPMACFDQEYKQISFLQTIFQPYGLEPNVAYQTGNLSTIAGMIRYNAMAALVYRCLEAQWPDLRFIPVDPDIPAEAALFWLPDATGHANIAALAECAKDLEF